MQFLTFVLVCAAILYQGAERNERKEKYLKKSRLKKILNIKLILISGEGHLLSLEYGNGSLITIYITEVGNKFYLKIQHNDTPEKVDLSEICSCCLCLFEVLELKFLFQENSIIVVCNGNMQKQISFVEPIPINEGAELSIVRIKEYQSNDKDTDDYLTVKLLKVVVDGEHQVDLPLNTNFTDNSLGKFKQLQCLNTSTLIICDFGGRIFPSTHLSNGSYLEEIRHRIQKHCSSFSTPRQENGRICGEIGLFDKSIAETLKERYRITELTMALNYHLMTLTASSNKSKSTQDKGSTFGIVLIVTAILFVVFICMVFHYIKRARGVRDIDK